MGDRLGIPGAVGYHILDFDDLHRDLYTYYHVSSTGEAWWSSHFIFHPFLYVHFKNQQYFLLYRVFTYWTSQVGHLEHETYSTTTHHSLEEQYVNTESRWSNQFDSAHGTICLGLYLLPSPFQSSRPFHRPHKLTHSQQTSGIAGSEHITLGVVQSSGPRCWNAPSLYD